MAGAAPLRFDPTSRAFLGVERSMTGQAWRARLDDAGAAQAAAIAQRLGLPDLLARVLAGRGVTAEAAEAHLDPTLRRHLPEPHTLLDMERAATRLADAVLAHEQIAVFGDYDVDGATSVALLAEWLVAAGLEPRTHIPDRVTEGYGPNEAAIARLREEGASLLVTVDCGTTGFEPLAAARRLGLDTIVVDHHQAEERLPDAVAVVNPNRLDDVSGQGHLAACGVVFLLLVATSRALRGRGHWTPDRPEPDLRRALDLVALGTVADVVPLRGLNRAYVVRGLEVMRHRARPGLRALMDVARLDGPPRPYHLGFLLGPRINAGGRIGDAALGARLLATTDERGAAAMAAELDRYNRERQAVETHMVEEAVAEAEAALGASSTAAAVVTASDAWHPGVVGLVAARLKERFGRPAFAIAFGESGIGTGSGRSVAGIDLGRAVRAALARGLLHKGGGHAMAAGLTMARDELGAFRAFLEEHLAALGPGAEPAGLAVDGVVQARGATPDLVHLMERAGPFGQGNPEPVLAAASHQLAHAEPVGATHLRLRLRARDGATLEGIAFRALGRPLGDGLLAARGRLVHVAGPLGLNSWNGRERVQLRVEDAALAE